MVHTEQKRFEIGPGEKILKKIAWILSAAVLMSAALFFYAVYSLNRYASTPADMDAGARTFVVRSGEGVSKIAGHLASEGLIIQPLGFRLFARVNGLDKKIKAGEYSLSGSMSPSEILDKLISGKVLLYRLTIPEGYTMAQIADLVGSSGIAGRDDFLKALANKRLMEKRGIEADSFEGYLFPDTYFFPKNTPAGKIVDVLVTRFRAVFTPERLGRAEELGLSVHEVVTLASIIEKETGAPRERPLISSVFHNRLKRGMRLESDPTVIYGIEEFDGNITRKHLDAPTAYNTYRIRGLPPGPIANPGEKAIEAALYPADTSYIYFVAKKDGTHHFSTNIQEHNRAVARYQLRR